MNIKNKIEIEFEVLTLQTKYPFTISHGSLNKKENILVKLHFEGYIGLGEAAPVSYHAENKETVLAILLGFKEKDLLGSDPFALEEIRQRMDKFIDGHNAAKAAVEMALYDLCGKILKLPVYQLLGLTNNEIKAANDFTIGIADIELIEKKILEALADGHKILKIKLGTNYDKEIIKIVHKIAPDLTLRIDANASWDLKNAIQMSSFLSNYKVELIEQALPKRASLTDWKILRSNSSIPIFIDESCSRSQDAARFADFVDGIVVKIAKSGGIHEAQKLIHMANAHGMKIMLGCMLESSLALSAAAQLASLSDYLDLDSSFLLTEDPFSGTLFEKNKLKLSSRPGLGIRNCT